MVDEAPTATSEGEAEEMEGDQEEEGDAEMKHGVSQVTDHVGSLPAQLAFGLASH